MVNSKKKPTKKAKKAISKLHTLVDYLEFYMGSNHEVFRDKVVKELASYVEETLHHLSVEQSIDHIKLATKLKTTWKKQQEEEIQKEVEDRLEEAIEQRIDDLKQMSKGEDL